MKNLRSIFGPLLALTVATPVLADHVETPGTITPADFDFAQVESSEAHRQAFCALGLEPAFELFMKEVESFPEGSMSREFITPTDLEEFKAEFDDYCL